MDLSSATTPVISTRGQLQALPLAHPAPPAPSILPPRLCPSPISPAPHHPCSFRRLKGALTRAETSTMGELFSSSTQHITPIHELRVPSVFSAASSATNEQYARVFIHHTVAGQLNSLCCPLPMDSPRPTEHAPPHCNPPEYPRGRTSLGSFVHPKSCCRPTRGSCSQTPHA